MNNFFENNDTLVSHEINRGNSLKRSELMEQQAMRKAYCKVNNIEFEEIEIPEERGFMQGSLKVLVVMMWLFIAGVGLSVAFTGGNLIDFLGWWF